MKNIIPCICMTCGIRNDFSHENGFCQNGHDNWLEYRDVAQENEFFKRFAVTAGLSEDELRAAFLDTKIKQIKITNNG